MWFNRYYEKQFHNLLKPGNVLVIYGPRRAGKTSLIQKFLNAFVGRYFQGTGEDMLLADVFASQSVQRLVSHFSGYDLVVIDEAQYIPDIGLGLKMLVDHMPSVSVIASGSSSFDLSNKIGEPLTGRQKILLLFPISVLEWQEQFGTMDVMQKLEDFLVFGMFPEVLQMPNIQDKIEYLNTLRDSYLLKDVLILENIRNAAKLTRLLQLLAYQIGKHVSLSELAGQLGLSKQTVERYLDLLEKVFIIKRVGGFSRNLRKEITKSNRYYFLDNGIRNALINNFNSLSSRDDVGMLWENFIFAERLKRNTYLRRFANYYFWRTYNGQEVDLVEEEGGRLNGYELTWNPKRKRLPKLWLDTYKNATFEIIHSQNFLDFVT